MKCIHLISDEFISALVTKSIARRLEKISNVQEESHRVNDNRMILDFRVVKNTSI